MGTYSGGYNLYSHTTLFFLKTYFRETKSETERAHARGRAEWESLQQTPPWAQSPTWAIPPPMRSLLEPKPRVRRLRDWATQVPLYTTFKLVLLFFFYLMVFWFIITYYNMYLYLKKMFIYKNCQVFQIAFSGYAWRAENPGRLKCMNILNTQYQNARFYLYQQSVRKFSIKYQTLR